jgi:hypothetical protein
MKKDKVIIRLVALVIITWFLLVMIIAFVG